MKLKFFGDSYDIVKQSLLRWLHPLGTWLVHPMFTEPVDPESAAEFARFLDAPLLTTNVLDAETNRTEYFAEARQRHEHLFLDPDTGLRHKPAPRNKAPSYLFDSELLCIANSRPQSLTLVFDQSLAFGKEKEPQLHQKLSDLESQGLAAIAYNSHACFILVGRNRELVARAHATLLCERRLLAKRFVGVVTAMESLPPMANTGTGPQKPAATIDTRAGSDRSLA